MRKSGRSKRRRMYQCALRHRALRLAQRCVPIFCACHSRLRLARIQLLSCREFMLAHCDFPAVEWHGGLRLKCRRCSVHPALVLTSCGLLDIDSL